VELPRFPPLASLGGNRAPPADPIESAGPAFLKTMNVAGALLTERPGAPPSFEPESNCAGDAMAGSLGSLLRSTCGHLRPLRLSAAICGHLRLVAASSDRPNFALATLNW
jgi:hypothetical protein